MTNKKIGVDTIIKIIKNLSMDHHKLNLKPSSSLDCLSEDDWQKIAEKLEELYNLGEHTITKDDFKNCKTPEDIHQQIKCFLLGD